MLTRLLGQFIKESIYMEEEYELKHRIFNTHIFKLQYIHNKFTIHIFIYTIYIHTYIYMCV